MIKPINDRVLIKCIKTDEMTPGGLYIPDAAKAKPQKGSVIAVGSGHLTADGVHVPLAVEVGDVVLFGKYSGTEVPLGDDYLVLKEEDILGIIENQQ